MRVNVNRELLSRELSTAQNIVEKKTTIAILTNVLLRVSEGMIHLTATDLDLTYQSQVEADIEEDGSLTVLASKISEIFRLLPTDDVSMYLTEHSRLRVEGQSLFYELPTQSADDFPRIPEVGDFGGITVRHNILKLGLEKVLPSIAQDEYRYQFGAILARMKNEELELISMDGHRLNHVTIPARLDPGVNFPDVLITRKAAHELIRLDGGDTVRLVQHEKFVAFLYANRKMTCRQPQVSFPDYQSFLQHRNDELQLVFNRHDMAESIKRVSVVSGGNYRGIKFILKPNSLTLDGSHPDYGEAVETLTVEYDGPAQEIAFDSRYLQEFLQTVHTDRVHAYFKNRDEKVLFTPEGEDDIQHQHILMPMTL